MTTNELIEQLNDAAAGWLRCPTGPMGWLTHPELMREAAARLAELDAVVERLPKTADGVPIVPGMTIYKHLPAGFTLSEYLCFEDVGGGLHLLTCGPAFYSTRAAALAASATGKGGPT